MALSRRSGSRFTANIWPGFVDAMTALLLVLMFVLTIFMIVQFVLRETISGQDEELNNLSNQVASLAQALGLEQKRAEDLQANVSTLSSSLSSAEELAALQLAQISSLRGLGQNQAAQIADFESQVAGLLARNTDLDLALADASSQLIVLNRRTAELSDENQELNEQSRLLLADKEALEEANLQVISEREALRLALAKSREEIDRNLEVARLAAAKREMLESLTAELRRDAEQSAISLQEALVALSTVERQLTSNQHESTAVEQKLAVVTQELETKKTELSAAENLFAQNQSQLTDVTAAMEQLERKFNELKAGLSDTEEQQLAEALAAEALRKRLSESQDELTAMSLSLEKQRKQAEDTLTILAAVQVERDSLKKTLGESLSQEQKRAALLELANQRLSAEQELSQENQRKLALLNQQIIELRKQLDVLQGLLDASGAGDQATQVRIETLGRDLNAALAQVAAEQKQRAELEAEKRQLLEAETQDLRQFKSEFFARLKDVLANQEGVRVVGDRFAFSSEVLFPAGSATLGAAGRRELGKVARVLLNVAEDIPPEIDWILRVDGHTDSTPLGGFGEFADNWDLSQARSLSVVRHLINNLGVPGNRLAANGFGEFQPISLGTESADHAQNRRIELKLTER